MVADWNATAYHELSAPQQAWGRRVLDRVAFTGDETVLDLGCGTGRLTALIRERAPRGTVVGLDRSASMLRTAQAWVRAERLNVHLVQGTATALPFVRQFDVIFSAATFHWVRDHDALFASIFAALRPGGRLVSQCGGGPNLDRLLRRADTQMDDPRFRPYFEGWQAPWLFAGVADTTVRLQRVGFEDVQVTLEAAPTMLDDWRSYRDFLSCVCVRHHVDRLPPNLGEEFLSGLADSAASDDPPFTLDYWRLNIDATRPFEA